MSAVACRVPEALAAADLWHVLRRAVRRAGDPADGRPLVADSKQVYSTARGLAGLETGVLSTLLPGPNGRPLTLRDCLAQLCPAAGLHAEPWYAGDTPLPAAAALADCRSAAARFETVCRDQGIGWGAVRSVVVCPAAFNALLDRRGSKGAVLGHALTELLRFHLGGPDPEPAAFVIDKHGGRNAYAAMLQEAVPGGAVVALREGPDRSEYRVRGLGREVGLTFQPRADAEHFCAALASMVSKYLRELLMGEFNRFWQAQVPGLKPTAGYPGDAARFLAAIRPALRRLGVAEETVWRRK